MPKLGESCSFCLPFPSVRGFFTGNSVEGGIQPPSRLHKVTLMSLLGCPMNKAKKCECLLSLVTPGGSAEGLRAAGNPLICQEWGETHLVTQKAACMCFSAIPTGTWDNPCGHPCWHSQGPDTWSDGIHPTPRSMAVGPCWMPGGTHRCVSVSQTPACLLVCLQPETPIDSFSLQGFALSLLLLCSDGILWKLAPSVPMHQIWLKLLNKGLKKVGPGPTGRKRNTITGILMLSRKKYPDLYGRQECAWGKAAS